MRSYVIAILLIMFSVIQVKANNISDVVSNTYSASQKKVETKIKHRKYKDPFTEIAYGVGDFLTSVFGPRPPHAWCGWWMRTQKGGGPEYNVARNWANRGTNAGGPKVGAVVVWPHHVGIITGKSQNGMWIVKSGNDGNAVRERPQSVAGAIAFRIL